MSPTVSSTAPCWRCATSSTTSPSGDGPNARPDSWSSPPTSPGCRGRCPAPSPPTTTPGLMAAVAELDDPFARCGLTLLRGAGLRLGELLDLELGQRHRLRPGRHLAEGAARQARHRTVGAARPRDPRRCSTSGPHTAARNAPIRTRAPAGSPTSCSAERGHRLGPWRIRNGLRPAVAAAGLTGADGQPLRCHSAPTAAHLRHRPGQRRDEPASPDGAARPRHRRDDPALRHPRLTDPARRLRRSHGQGRRPRCRSSSPAGPSLPPRSTGSAARCSRPASPTATAPATSPPAPAPTPTSARPATTTSPPPSSHPHSKINSPTSQALRDDAERRGWTTETTRHQAAHRTPPEPPRPHRQQLTARRTPT